MGLCCAGLLPQPCSVKISPHALSDFSCRGSPICFLPARSLSGKVAAAGGMLNFPDSLIQGPIQVLIQGQDATSF
jgi:hypothetical protein